MTDRELAERLDVIAGDFGPANISNEGKTLYEAAARLRQIAEAEPVAMCIRSKRDGSFSNQVAVCSWATFDREMDKLRNDPWVQKGIAEIVPLYIKGSP